MRTHANMHPNAGFLVRPGLLLLLDEATGNSIIQQTKYYDRYFKSALHLNTKMPRVYEIDRTPAVEKHLINQNILV